MKYVFLIFLVSIGIIVGFGYLSKGNIDLNEDFATLQNTCEQVSADNSTLQGRLGSEVNAHRDTLAALQAKEGELVAVSSNLSACEVDKANAAAEITKRDEEIAALNQQVATLQSDLIAANENTERAQTERDGLASQISGLQHQVNRAVTERDAIRQLYESAIRKISRDEGEITVLRQQVQDLTEQLKIPAVLRLLKSVLEDPDNLPNPLYLTLGLLIGGAASTAGLVLIVRQPKSRKRPAILHDDLERRFYHEMAQRQRGRL